MRTRSKVLRRVALPAMAVPLLTAMCLAVPGSANAASLSNAQTAARAAAATKQAVAQAITASPSDSALNNATKAQLVSLAIRCVPIDGLTYCLHRGWEDSAAAATKDVTAAVSTAAATTANAAVADGGGDMSLLTALRGWAKLSRTQRVAQETSELNAAVAAAGKEVFYTYVVIREQPLPADFAAEFPDLATWVPQATQILAREQNLTARFGVKAAGVTPDVPAPEYDHAITMDTSKMKKQENGYYCGPTSLQALVWNSPSSAQYQSQSYWAGKLGTTSSDGTYIGNLNTDINTYTTWDSTSYAGTYGVHSISSWSVGTWENLFDTQLGTHHAPVQLHPILSAANTDYYPATTSGHFDVGRGYDYDYVSGHQYDLVYLFEPAGGAAEKNVYPSVTATDSTEDIRAANLANTSQRDIAY